MNIDTNLLCITDSEYIEDYTIRLTFSDGKVKKVNFLPLLKGEWLSTLKDKNNFTQYSADGYTLEWFNGIGFAPEFLYKNGIEE